MIELSYTLSERDYAALYRFTQRDQVKAYRTQIVQSLVYYGLPLALAIYALLPEQMFIGIVLIVSLAAFIYSNISSLMTASVPPSSMSIEDRSVRLVVSDEGLREEAAGISSLASWSAVLSFAIVGDWMFIELANGLWGIVPKLAVSSESTVDQIVAEFKVRGVTQKTA